MLLFPWAEQSHWLGLGRGGLLAVGCAWCAQLHSPAESLSCLAVEQWGQAGLCLLHLRPWARMPAGPRHSGQQHVPMAVTLLSLPAASSLVLLWWQCNLQLAAGEAHGGCRRCGLLRFGLVSKSSDHRNSNLWDRPGTLGSAWLGAACCLLPARALLCTEQTRKCLLVARVAASWGALTLPTSCIQHSRAGAVLPCGLALPNPGQDMAVVAGPGRAVGSTRGWFLCSWCAVQLGSPAPCWSCSRAGQVQCVWWVALVPA